MQTPSGQQLTRIYTFADFAVDTGNFHISKAGEPLKMTPRAFEVLLYLVENSGRVIGKQELFDHVWGDTFVTDNALTRMVKEIRQVLGDSAESPSYIETVPKRGYRFLLPIESSGPQDDFTYQRILVEEEVVEVDDGAMEFTTESGVSQVQNGRGVRKIDPTVQAGVHLAFMESHAVWKDPWRLIFLGLCLVAGIGYVAYRTLSIGDRNQSGAKPVITRLTANGRVQVAAVSPDGRFAAFVASGSERQGLWLKNINSGTEKQIVLPPEQRTLGNLRFSPDGDFIFYVSNENMYKLSVLGDTPKKVRADLHSALITFAPDGKRFAYLRTPAAAQEQSDLVIADAETGEDLQVLVTSRRPNLLLLSPSWSPDGKLIACAASNATGTEIVTVRVDDGLISPLPMPPSWSPNIGQVIWRPDGQALLVTVEEYKNVLTQVWSMSFPEGQFHRITDDSHNYRSLSISADGRSLVGVRTQQEAHLWVMPATGETSQAKQVTTGFEKYDGAFSINWVGENEIFYANAPSGRFAVWRIGTDGSGLKEIWPEGRHAAVSPDGQFIVYQVEDGKNTGLFRASLKDGEKRRLTTGSDESPVFTSDGKWVIFTRFGDDVALWRTSVDGSSEPTRLTDFPGYPENASVSPDGKSIAFYRGTNGLMRFPQLAVIPFEGGKPTKEFDIPIFFLNVGNAKKAVQWTSDGQGIYHIPFRAPFNIWRQPIDGSAATQVTNFDTGIIFNYAFSPAGKQLAVSRGTIDRDAVMITDFW